MILPLWPLLLLWHTDCNHTRESPRFCLCGPVPFPSKFWLQSHLEITQIMSLWSLRLCLEILITITIENHPDSVSVVPPPFLRNSDYNHTRTSRWICLWGPSPFPRNSVHNHIGESPRFCLCGPSSFASTFWLQSHLEITQVMLLWSLPPFHWNSDTITIECHPDSVSVVPPLFPRKAD